MSERETQMSLVIGAEACADINSPLNEGLTIYMPHMEASRELRNDCLTAKLLVSGEADFATMKHLAKEVAQTIEGMTEEDYDSMKNSEEAYQAKCDIDVQEHIETRPVISLHSWGGNDHMAFVGTPDDSRFHDRDHITLEIPAQVHWVEAAAYLEKTLKFLRSNISGYKNAQVRAVSGVNNDVKQLAQAVGDAEGALENEMDRHVTGFSEPIF